MRSWLVGMPGRALCLVSRACLLSAPCLGEGLSSVCVRTGTWEPEIQVRPPITGPHACGKGLKGRKLLFLMPSGLQTPSQIWMLTGS